MSHIHLPDGVIPFVWCILGFALCFVLLWVFIKRIKGEELRKKIPLAGVVSAMMLIFMSVPLGFLPIHLSLATLSGILAGPGLSFIAIFVVNTILALMGHGGFTTIGINVLLMGTEAIVGYYLFKALSKKMSCTFSAILSSIAALLLSVSLMVLVVGYTAGFSNALPIHNHAHDSMEETHISDNEHGETANSNEDNHNADEANKVENVHFLSLTGWSAAAVIMLVGITIESLFTGLIVNFFSKVRPDILDSALHT